MMFSCQPRKMVLLYVLGGTCTGYEEGKWETSLGWHFDASGRQLLRNCNTLRNAEVFLFRTSWIYTLGEPTSWSLNLLKPWRCWLNQRSYILWVFCTCPRGLLRSWVGTKDMKKFLAVKTLGSPGPLLAMIQVSFIRFIYCFSCQISFKEMVCSEKKRKKKDIIFKIWYLYV